MLDELCLILTGLALVATIFLAPHDNSMRCVTMLIVVHIMLKVYRESEVVSGKKVR